MPIGRVNAAKYTCRFLPEPHESELGGEEAHALLAEADADICCPPSGWTLSWDDCYASADMLPLPRKADLFLDERGRRQPLPLHLTGEQVERAERAQALAVHIRRSAHRRGIY
ncbi:hypothetical protein [Streptomyces sp. NPDC056670]|uniref:hypothetical protein n=1 Tax=Streptomyces sp. NPDC056670 TaxID=3345904 RepID=UPI0036C402DF